MYQTKCYCCQTKIRENSADAYWLLLEWTGNTRIGGHRRSVREFLCSRKCLGKTLETIGKE